MSYNFRVEYNGRSCAGWRDQHGVAVQSIADSDIFQQLDVRSLLAIRFYHFMLIGDLSKEEMALYNMIFKECKGKDTIMTAVIERLVEMKW